MPLMNAQQLRAEIARLSTAMREESAQPNPDKAKIQIWSLRRQSLQERLWTIELNAATARWA
ncbi:hypothetical protein [Caulobacter sp. X]|uniref:hypothetical protein n=1 Tax=Caulobacter sp. X TaxID=2048901 RepID=UPI000C14E670|nr:hypothetical protein [Caulobacter sp. X]PIC01775.1 hypothetical protein CSW60_09925 [Caulobacter sp. X]